MSRNEAIADRGCAIPGPAANGWEDRLRHLLISFAPLAIYVAVVLGYEPMMVDTPAPHMHPLQTAAIDAKAASVAAVAPLDRTQPAPSPALPQPATQIQPSRSDAGPELHDGRSLLDLARSADAQPLAAASVVRFVTVAAGTREPVSLSFGKTDALQPGGYGSVRGVARSATLTYGVAVGKDTWLIDAPDLERVAINLNAAAAGSYLLDLFIHAPDGRVVSSERVSIEIRPAAPVVAATSEPAATAPPAAPAQPLPVPVGSPSLPASTLTPTLALELAPEAGLVPGRAGMLPFAISPKGAAPEGSYMLLRGLPPDTILTRGLAVGSDVWLLNLAELAEVEVRLPERTAGNVKVAAKLISADGRLLAERTASFDAVSQVRASTSEPTLKRGPVPAERRDARGKQGTPPPVSPEKPAPANASLVRGLKMLEIGNLVSARPLLERAVAEGSGEAAAWLGASFDPSWLKRSRAVGIAGDAALARHWYDEAHRLGAGDIEKVISMPAGSRLNNAGR